MGDRTCNADESMTVSRLKGIQRHRPFSGGSYHC